jgi:hypothetical protein
MDAGAERAAAAKVAADKLQQEGAQTRAAAAAAAAESAKAVRAAADARATVAAASLAAALKKRSEEAAARKATSSAPTPSAASPKNVSTAAPKEAGEGAVPTSNFLVQILEMLSIPFDKAVIHMAPEIGHLSPLILTIGSLFMAISTLNYPYAVLSLTSFEALAIHSLLHTIADYTTTSSSTGPESSQNPACSSYFQTLTPSRFRSILDHGIVSTFPTTSLYFLSFIAAYCIQSLLVFSNECSELGPQYSNRPYLAIASACLFLILYALYIYVNSCSSILSIAGTIALGTLIGILLCYQNSLLLGKSSVNLLFIPEITRRTGMDYICATVNTRSS